MKISASKWLCKQLPTSKSERVYIADKILSNTIIQLINLSEDVVNKQCTISYLNELPILDTSSLLPAVHQLDSSQYKNASCNLYETIINCRDQKENVPYMDSMRSGTTPGPKCFNEIGRSYIYADALVAIICGEICLLMYRLCLEGSIDQEYNKALKRLSMVKQKYIELSDNLSRLSDEASRKQWFYKPYSHNPHSDELDLVNRIVLLVGKLKSEVWPATFPYKCFKSLLDTLDEDQCCNKKLCKHIPVKLKWHNLKKCPWTQGEQLQVAISTTASDCDEKMVADDLDQTNVVWTLKWFRKLYPDQEISNTLTLDVGREDHVCFSLILPNWLCSRRDRIQVPIISCARANFLISSEFFGSSEHRFADANQYCIGRLTIDAGRGDAAGKFGILYRKCVERLIELDIQDISGILGIEKSRMQDDSDSIQRRNNSFEKFMNFWCLYFVMDKEGMCELCSEYNLFGVSNFTEVRLDYLNQVKFDVDLHRLWYECPRRGTHISTIQAVILTSPFPTIEDEIANLGLNAINPAVCYLNNLTSQVGCFLYKGMMCSRNISIHTSQYDSFKAKFQNQPDTMYNFLRSKIAVKPSQILMTKSFNVSILPFVATLFLKPPNFPLHLWLLQDSHLPLEEETTDATLLQAINSQSLSGTMNFYITVFLQHLVSNAFSPELCSVVCKALWVYQMPDSRNSEIHHILMNIRSRMSPDSSRSLISLLLLRKFTVHCIIHQLIYEFPASQNQLALTPQLMTNFINYVRRYGRIGSRRVQLDRINRLIEAMLVLLKTSQASTGLSTSWNPQPPPSAATTNKGSLEVYDICKDILADYIIPNLYMIHAASGFCEIRKAVLEMNHPKELVNIVKSVDLGNLKDLGDKVYQVTKIGSSYEVLKDTVNFLTSKIDASLNRIVSSFITTITLIPSVYTQLLTALILQFIRKLEASDTSKKKWKTATDEQLALLNNYLTRIMNIQLTEEEKASSFVTEGLKTIKSIVLDAIESCRHYHRNHQDSTTLAKLFSIIDTELLIKVSLQNGYNQRAIMLCEEFLTADNNGSSYYSDYPLEYFQTFRSNREPDINVYATNDETIIRVWETCDILVNSTDELRWLGEVDDYCDSILDRLKVVKNSANHSSEIYEAESNRLTQLCGTLCAEDVLRLKDWSGIMCIWDSVLLLPQKYLCQKVQVSQPNIKPPSFALLALPHTGMEFSGNPPMCLEEEAHMSCQVCQLCKLCDCLCSAAHRLSSISQFAVSSRPMKFRSRGQLGLINALGILGHSAATSDLLEPVRLQLLKEKFNSQTLVHQWIQAYEMREEKPHLIDDLIRHVCSAFDEIANVPDVDRDDVRQLLVSEEDVCNENKFAQISVHALNLQRPPEKVENIDTDYFEATRQIAYYPNHVHYRLDFAHNLYNMLNEEVYERTLAERSCKKPIDLLDEPLNSITRMSLSDLYLKCMEEYLICASLDNEISMTCILRWICLLCAIPSYTGNVSIHVIDVLGTTLKREFSSRLCSSHLNLIANVPIRVWFKILPQLVCRATILMVGPSICVPLISRLLLALPHQTLWYLAQLWASTRSQFRTAADRILSSALRLQSGSPTEPLEAELIKKIKPEHKNLDLKALWTTMKKWTDLLTAAAEDTRIPPGDCSLKTIYPMLATYSMENILMPIKETLWVSQQAPPTTILQKWKNQSALYKSPSRLLGRLSLPVVYMELDDVPLKEIWMRAINNRIVVYRSKQRPKRISCLGCDGNIYYFLLKFEGTGDLRKDARVEEIVNSTNENLPTTIATRSITFLVLCLKELAGIIEWVCGVSTLKDCIRDASCVVPGASNDPISSCDNKLRFTHRPKQSEYGEVLRNYVECGLQKNPPSLHKWYLKVFGDSASNWLRARRNYVDSLAIWNCIGYIIGLGDRHCENLLVSALTGHIIHVDFDCLFDKGQTKLNIPELVPFRMTPNIVAALGSYYKIMRANMISVIDISLKMRFTDFQALLYTFVTDPAVEYGNVKTELLNHLQWKIQGKLNHSCHFTKLCIQNPKTDRYKLAAKVPRPDCLPVVIATAVV